MAIYNISLLGDGGVGKTAWIHKMQTDEFHPQYYATVGCEVHPFVLNTNYGNIELNLYDYAGQEKYNSQSYYKSDATILMFDLTSRVSYKNLKYWQNKCTIGVPVFVVGNKSDCADIKVAPDIPYLALSAKRMTLTDLLTDLLTPILRRLTMHDDLVIVE